MGKQDQFADEFKRDAVAQIVDRVYSVCDMAARSDREINLSLDHQLAFVRTAKNPVFSQ